MSFSIAYQMYSILNDANKDLDTVFKTLKEAGLDGVEVFGYHGHTVEEYKNLLKKYDLRAISCHLGLNEFENDPEAKIKEMADVGCEYITFPYSAVENLPGGENYEATLEAMRKVAKIGHNYGITFCFHNHTVELTKKINGQPILEKLYEDTGADVLQSELDLCWVANSGYDPVEYIKKYEGRAPIIHVKDFAFLGSGKMPEEVCKVFNRTFIPLEEGEEHKFTFMPVGQGLQNIPAIIKSAEAVSAKWLIIEQDAPALGMNAIESAKASIKYLKQF